MCEPQFGHPAIGWIKCSPEAALYPSHYTLLSPLKAEGCDFSQGRAFRSPFHIKDAYWRIGWLWH